MLKRADFYILKQSTEQARLILACKLADKAYKNGQAIFIFTANDASSQMLDELLWTFDDSSFIPHATDIPLDALHPVVISCHPPSVPVPILANVSDTPIAIGQTERVLEIILNTDSSKDSGRERYKKYQSAGVTIETHSV